MNQKGIALIIAYTAILVLLMLSSIFLFRSISEGNLTGRFVYSTRAFWLAEAGINRAFWELNYGDGNWTNWIDSASNAKTLEGSQGAAGDFTVTVTNYQSNITSISSTGLFPNKTAPDQVSRTLEVIAQQQGSLFNYAAFGNSGVSLSGQAQTDSYDSSLGPYGNTNISQNGDVGTNADITASGQTYIYGDASTGANGIFNEEDRVSGTITHDNNLTLPGVTVPAQLSNLTTSGDLILTAENSQTISSGDHKYNSFNLSGQSSLTIVGPANIYITAFNSLLISGQAKIVISSTSTGPVTIYTDGGINASGVGVVNETNLPSNLFFYGSSSNTQNFSFSGQSDLYAAIYAPSVNLSLSGQSDYFGSFMGNSVAIGGQTKIHYDTALRNLNTTSANKYKLKSWRDTQSL